MTEVSTGVTGATGWLGGLVIRHLADRGIAQRLVVRSTWPRVSSPDKRRVPLRRTTTIPLRVTR